MAQVFGPTGATEHQEAFSRVRPSGAISPTRTNAWNVRPCSGARPSANAHPRQRAARPRKRPPHQPRPRPRNRKPAAEARRPACARRGGASYAAISRHKSPHPLVRRELGPLAPARMSRPPASSGCSAAVERDPRPEPTGYAPPLYTARRSKRIEGGAQTPACAGRLVRACAREAVVDPVLAVHACPP
jgi:hypothetical protein